MKVMNYTSDWLGDSPDSGVCLRRKALLPTLDVMSSVINQTEAGWHTTK